MEELNTTEVFYQDEVELLVPLDAPDPETTCIVCYAEFLESEDLQSHMAQMHPESVSKQESCCFCTKTFSDKHTYSKHLVQSHFVNIKCCKYCSRVYSDLFKLLQHEAKHIHHKDKSLYNCSSCKLTFRNVVELEKHEYEQHSAMQDGAFLFDVYSLLSSVLNMKVDSFLHAPYNTLLFCIQCRFETKSKVDYINHLAQHKGSLVCDKCCRVFKWKKGLVKHLKKKLACQLYIDEDMVKEKCYHCQRVFHISLFKEHVKKCKPISCEPCGVIFTTLSELTKHQFLNHKSTLAFTKCKYCKKEFVNKENLQKHIDNVHGNDLHMYKYNCVYCHSVFKHPQKLFAHFFSTHANVNPFTCKICDMTFRVRKAFSLHIKLKHDSKGFVENDERFHVFFTDQEPVKVNVQTTADDVHNDCANDENENDKSKYEKNKQENPEERKDVRFMSKRISNHRKRALISEVSDYELETEDTDDEPLILVKKRKKKVKQKKKQVSIVRLQKKHKLNLTCEICNKYCYTYQNYERHKSLHAKNERKRCIKCSKVFKSTSSLNEHITKSHSSSVLTEKLKSMLAKRKQVETKQQPNRFEMRKKFLSTFKKVKSEKTAKPSVIRACTSHNWSVKKYIENFVPDNTEKKYNNIDHNVTINLIDTDSMPEKQNIIRMTKFNAEPLNTSNIKLTMPTKFKEMPLQEVEHKVSMRIVDEPQEKFNIHLEPIIVHRMPYDMDYAGPTEQDYTDDYQANTIPEVAQEIMLDNNEEIKVKIPQQKTTYKINMPKIHKQVGEMRIAHLLPEAPFYKIVKVKDVIKKDQEVQPEEVPILVKEFGTKLINVNPLARFLKDGQVGDTEWPQRKYYKPKPINYPLAIAKALLELDNPKPSSQKKGRKRKTEMPLASVKSEVPNEECVE